MEDVLEVWEKAEPVICLDEKPVSLHDDVRPATPMAPTEFGRMVKIQEPEDQLFVDCEVLDERPNDSDLLTFPRKAPASCCIAFRI